MALTKIVNGVSIDLTSEEEAEMLASWAAAMPTLGEHKDYALVAVDVAAENARLRYITGGAGQAATYIMKEAQARAFKDVGYSGTAPGLVQAEATARSISAQAGCDAIIAQADAWSNLAAVIETSRRSAKVLIEAAADMAAVDVARDAAFAALGKV